MKPANCLLIRLCQKNIMALDRFVAREQVVEDLAQNNFLIEDKEYKNAVALCERCQTVLEPRLSDQWYMSMKELVKPAIAAVENKEISFYSRALCRHLFRLESQY